MPLIRSTSKKARQTNIREMIEAGHDPRQAVAASYRNQRDAKKKRAKHLDSWARGKRHSAVTRPDGRKNYAIQPGG